MRSRFYSAVIASRNNRSRGGNTHDPGPEFERSFLTVELELPLIVSSNLTTKGLN